MIRRPPRSKRTDTLFPYTTLFRSACFVTILVIDKIGRKPLLLIGSVGMAVTLGAMSWAFSGAAEAAAGNLALAPGAGWVALVAANLYVIFFNVSWGPVMWVMLGEMFPNQIRGSALTATGLAQWGANFLVVPPLDRK